MLLKVRQSLEVKLKCDLTQRKKLVDELVMDFVNTKNVSESPSESEEESVEEEPVKRKAKPASKKVKRSESDANSDSEEDYKPKKKKKKDDSDFEDWRSEKKPKKKPKSKVSSFNLKILRATIFKCIFSRKKLAPKKLLALLGPTPYHQNSPN